MNFFCQKCGLVHNQSTPCFSNEYLNVINSIVQKCGENFIRSLKCTWLPPYPGVEDQDKRDAAQAKAALHPSRATMPRSGMDPLPKDRWEGQTGTQH